MFALGILDDFLHLQPSTKLTGQIAVACLVIMLGSCAGLDGMGSASISCSGFSGS